MNSKLLALLALAGVAPAAAQPASHPAATAAIDSFGLRARTYYLTHDLLEGRGTGRRGGSVAALYLATEAERLGLVGAGTGGSYLQRVPLVEAEIDTALTKLALVEAASPGTGREFRTPGAFVPNVGTAATLVPFAGELAYVGTARDVLASPGRLPPLAGRVALVRGPFGAAMAAADTLRARGATGAVQLVDNGEQYQLYVRSRGPSRLYVAPEAGVISSFIPGIPSLIASPELGHALAPDLPAPGTEQDHPRLLEGKRVEVALVTHPRALAAQNVAAVLPGADPRRRGAVVVYTAHYDHLGISTPDQRGDSIYNGFSDNAAGCAMLLAIAERMAVRRPSRSVLFLFLTGEERGLLGSDYFATHPLVAPESIVAAINLDAGAPPAPSTGWQVAGGDRSTLGALAVHVARRAGWKAVPVGASPNTDYFPLLRIGVPAVFLIPGPEPFEGLDSAASQALRRRWDHYHQAADEWAPDFPFAGLVRYADYAYRLGVAAAAAPRQRMLAAP